MGPLSFSATKTTLVQWLNDALHALAPEVQPLIVLERPKQLSHGDFSCNIALQLAKPLRAKPRDIAQQLIDKLSPCSLVERTEIAGAGFINVFLTRACKQNIVQEILTAKEWFGHSTLTHPEKIQVEFVSANPTGPLHVGHGRGAAYGASLANLLSAIGHSVYREYYVNDAGRQMDILAVSTWLRYLEIHDQHIPFPPNAYQGEYVRVMATQLKNTYGLSLLRDAAVVLAQLPVLPAADQDSAEAKGAREVYLDALIAKAKSLLGPDYLHVHQSVLSEQLNDCRDDLTEFGVHFDVWFSERSLFDSGQVAAAVSLLNQNGYLYTQAGALWFKSTAFGDEKDRVVQRENGQFTYFASDIAYHLKKMQLGFDRIIDVWGADHHGYIARVKGALQALNADPNKLTISLVQFAVLYRNGEKVSMSTRSGQFVTLRELRQEVGNDAARFFYILRKSDQHLDFDLDLAKSRTNENPVYYIQYAHARVCSVFEASPLDPATLLQAPLNRLDSETELELLQKLTEFPEVINNAARELSPHLLAFYLKDLAALFHSYYNATRFLVEDQPLRLARLSLAAALRQVLVNGLRLLGVSAPEKM